MVSSVWRVVDERNVVVDEGLEVVVRVVGGVAVQRQVQRAQVWAWLGARNGDRGTALAQFKAVL